MIPESINLEFKANNRKRSKPLDIEASFLFPYFAKGMSKYNEDLSEYDPIGHLVSSRKKHKAYPLVFYSMHSVDFETCKFVWSSSAQ